MSDASSPPSTRVYVGNLPWATTNEELSSLLADYKPVRADVQKKLTGKSKGFALVEFSSVDAATKLVSATSPLKLGDRDLVVRFDRVTPSAGPSARLFVGNLPWSLDDEGLLALFSGLEIKEAKVKVVGGRSRGFGLVTFNNAQDAQKALDKKAEFDVDGRTVFARFDRQQE
eukprot:scpid107762/ scgid6489/ 28 kDa ribonucleoprotein, chloroplastic